jgi:hypothetical protein
MEIAEMLLDFFNGERGRAERVLVRREFDDVFDAKLAL